jgi:hypothetical protein
MKLSPLNTVLRFFWVHVKMSGKRREIPEGRELRDRIRESRSAGPLSIAVYSDSAKYPKFLDLH